MTSFRIESLRLERGELGAWGRLADQHRDWPVVYTLNDSTELYVGESVDATSRLRQHLDGNKKSHLGEARVIIDDAFNKSACLDLEAYLIGLFAGEGRFKVLNIQTSGGSGNYYQRDDYRERFREIFDKLRAEGLFTTTIEEIENSDLFKLSPFKTLTGEQSDAVIAITESLLADLRAGPGGSLVIEGGPGTGKTVVAVFLTKLLRDLGAWDGEPLENESVLAGLFTTENTSTLADLDIGVVVPQQSLRKSIQAVFARTPGLGEVSVLSPFDVGKSDRTWDLLIVDEAHRLNQRANQTSAQKNREFREINEKLFGADDPSKTQLDWIQEMSHQQLLLIDVLQRVRPADLDPQVLEDVAARAGQRGRLHVLTSQLRVRAGSDYVDYVRQVLGPTPPERRIDFGEYDVRFFERAGDMVSAVRERDAETGLARVVAGYAWPWNSKKDKANTDIRFDDESIELRWNSRVVDWVDSPKSLEEVGSIHTIQGYDLNYAGVIIGRDLRLDPSTGRLSFDRRNYFDKKGVQNNPGQKLSDHDLLEYVRNIYAVLLTRGIRGTYLYVVDPHLREHLRRYFG
ncbi:DUF2075 domain-containing protein [Nocardioides alcanivorans]|uniref:DUF2075 domain-containing protein n=1 Tax=Nocardioides alcanivorans TaxID=2897352 RepID=UPI001F31D8AE|nr:DUF2075 domain-containing protein [Nocardioides alcanivorans]